MGRGRGGRGDTQRVGMGPRIPVLTLIRDGLMGRHTGLSSQRASSHSALSEGEPPAFQVQPSSPPTPPPP